MVDDGWGATQTLRRAVLSEQASRVKSAIALANAAAQRDRRKRSVACLVCLLLFFSVWRLLQPPRVVTAVEAAPSVALIVNSSVGTSASPR